MQTRLVAVLLGAALMAAGCGGAGSDDGPVTIRFSWWGNDERARITNQAVDAFEAANPGIAVETESVDFTSYFDRLATSVAGSDEPDVITMGGAYPREYADRGVLLDLAQVPGQLDLSALDEHAMAGGNFEGTRYAVPTGSRTTPWLSWPARFAPTSSRAISPASSAAHPAAAKIARTVASNSAAAIRSS
jgi:multiple sugar transport system substrate-binding protein